MTETAAAPTPPARRYGKRKLADARNKVTHERWNEAEYETLATAAERAGLPVGAYIRRLVLGAPGPRARRRPRADQEALARLLGELGRIGSNVNQLARVANTNGSTPAEQRLAAILAELATVRDEVMKALGRGD